MSKPIPLHRVADLLGYATENELSTILRLVPGLPYETRRGVVYADPDALSDALADRGVVIPAELVTVPDERDNPDEDDEDQDDDDVAPRRRR